MEVILKLARKNPWAGIYKYKNCYDWIGTYITRSGNNYTGLSEEEARRLEKSLGYPEGHLAPTSAFWKTYWIKLGAKELILHTEYPADELKYLFLKNHKRVAVGLQNLNPSRDYLLINKDAEAEEANRLNRIKADAFVQYKKMSLDEMRKCLRIFGVKSDNISNELVESKLFEIIENNPQKFFLLWINNKNKETQFLIEEAISKNIIRKSKNVYYYGTDIIGNSLQDTIAYLDNKANQDLKIAIMSEIEAK